MCKVSVIIPTYKDSTRLSKCLRALSEQEYDVDLFEVIVVNNARDEVLPEFNPVPKNFSAMTETRPGSYAARNAGLEIASGSIIAFTDSDCIPEKDWLINAVSLFEGDPSIERISGPVKIFCKEKDPSVIELYDTIYAFPQKKYAENGLGVTANLFVRKQVFDKVGFFNSDTMSGGDLEWGSRAQKAGSKLKYSDAVIINHPARDSLKSLFKKARRVGEGQVIFAKSREGFWDLLLEILRGLKPKILEIRKVTEERSGIEFWKKMYLILIRHMVLWNMDFWRISTKTRIILSHKIRH